MNYLKTLVIACFVIALSSFTIYNVDNETAMSFSDDYICTMESEKLQSIFYSNFIDLFDDVDIVDAHYNVDVGYYYAVKGKKNNATVTEYFKVPKNYVDNAIFPVDNMTTMMTERIYCFYDRKFNCVRTTSFPAIRCGQVVGGRRCVEW